MSSGTNENFRIVHLGGRKSEHKFKSNRVITARYTWWNWVPKSLLMQFFRVNNVYFLIMSILSTFSFSPKSPYSIGGTLAIVLVFTMFKEGYEDLARHRQDNSVNRTFYLRFDYDLGVFVQVESERIKVGDVLKILEHESFPADLLMIGNSHDKGIAYVNTMNLDGETNLKEKILAHGLLQIKEEKDLKDFGIELQVDKPNMSLVKWNCNVRVNGELEALSLKQLLLRGCVLKNTDWVYGCAVYTGEDSKIVMNSKKPPTKISSIQRQMNRILISVFILQIAICIIYAGIGQSWLEDNGDAEYIDLPEIDGSSFILKVLTYWVNYSHMIPISLYVALEIIKLLLASFIKNDIEMYYAENDRTANCRASDLIEELGQVQFIFSDKTGTLTCNEMVFRKCGINSKVYGHSQKAIQEDPEIKSILSSSYNPEHASLHTYFLMLALCNSVFPAKHEGKLVYQASSPDELALVEAAKSVGFVLLERSEGKIYIETQGSKEDWDLLTEIPFNSDRKRMSVVVRECRTGRILLFTKGADSTMLGLLKPNNIKKISEDLKIFATEGLRTLVYGYKVLETSEYEAWAENWKKIQIGNSPDKEQILDDHGARLEMELVYVGTSAIEDKLQNGVPETIKILLEASIRVWVLTGDKEETAIEIAKSCNLIQPEMEVSEVFTDTLDTTRSRIKDLIKKFSIGKILDFKELEKKKTEMEKPLALVINGSALAFVLENEKLKKKFFKLGFISSSCICCRVSPAQKMYVVRLASTYGKWISLAIGDGANDVSMIQEANIGVGIAGKEGTQAVQAADFTFCEFRSLQRLLLVHGRYAYFRVSLFILYYFYKNFISVFTEFWFALFNGFSGQIFFLDWLPSLYNSFWTSWPCLTFFTLERDFMPKISLKYPGLYSAGQKSAHFNIKTFWKWIVFAFLSACWLFWLPILACSRGVGNDGHEPSLFWVSTISFIMLIHTVNLKLLLVSFFWAKYSL